jgi:hypothetical protein
LRVEQLDDLAEAELLDRAVVRIALLIASDDDRVALRASLEVLDRVLGSPKQAVCSAPERHFAVEAEGACDKLAEILDRAAAARSVTA